MVLWDEKVRNAAGHRFPSWDNGRMVYPITLMISEGVGVEAGVGGWEGLRLGVDTDDLHTLGLTG